MLTMLKVLGQYVWGKFEYNESGKGEDKDIERELAKFENEKSKEVNPLVSKEESPFKIGCFDMSGKITKLTRTFGLIDNVHHFFVTEDMYENFRVNDSVHYLAYSLDKKKTLKVVKILSVAERSWEKSDFNSDDVLKVSIDNVNSEFGIGTHDIIGKVAKRKGRIVVLEDSGAEFNLDHVKSNFLPVIGDWLQLNTEVQLNEGATIDKTVGEILQVNSISSLRSKQVEGRITYWDKTKGFGIVNNTILVKKDFCNHYFDFNVGDQVFVDAIESDQGKHQWRALSITVLKRKMRSNRANKSDSVSTETNCKYGVTVSEDSNFGALQIGETKTITVCITNDSQKSQRVLSVEFLHKSNDVSQMKIQNLPAALCTVGPGKSSRVTVECVAKFYGLSEEILIYRFENFDIRQVFKIDVKNLDWEFNENVPRQRWHLNEARESIRRQQDHIGKNWIPGIKTIKPPPFIAQRLPTFPIPKEFWDIVRKCYEENDTHSELNRNLEKAIPGLNMELSIDNYVSKFQSLLYLEELHSIIRLERYNMERAYMSASGQYLVLHIEGLSERRPSLMIGDSVKVQTSDNTTLYEGCIHQIQSTSIFLQFSPDFHTKYKGEDVSVEFCFSRSTFIKCHQCVVLAVAHLGKEILFPDSLKFNPLQIDAVDAKFVKSDQGNLHSGNSNIMNLKKEKKVSISWLNKNLNDNQKAAVLNVLRAVSRPLPYVIFGPPGTGKTMTLVETILQLLKNIPDSRLLVATPSNSAADNLAEQLIKFGTLNPGTMVRLIAQHIAKKGNISDVLKPYCATVDISMELKMHKRPEYNAEGVKMNCPKSVLGRHRISIGTCSCLGSFLKLGFPHGHFTHIVIDEAGQATEPEIMVPMSFANKLNANIILAGDPMQLGPVVLSQFSNKYGLEESYLERLLKTFPYQKDYDSFGSENGGYDSRLVTRLKKNYRSIPKVLDLPSKMFYDNNLEPRLTNETEWVSKDIASLSMFLTEKGWNLDNGFPGIVFHGIRGVDYRAEENPSWFNPCEASMALMCTLKLYRFGFQPSDIGIIAPYVQQSIHIRSLFQELTDECPKTGSVEDFQGQERKIIIVTTVRCSVSLLNSDLKNVLGFVKHPKRLNVSLTRAKVLLIIIGDPHLLVKDPLWCEVINYVLKSGSYIGCNLPKELTE